MTKPKTFEASMDRLDEIVTLLEENEQPLDETIGLFEEGLKLIKSCDDRLKVFEQKVEELSKANGETK
ncbi:MAG: exodeoxyribonuclease VII small subunit [Solobacterium sp.]|nr:exodeoxyribonuclease VII small subunit [Solobacterium sp.]